MSNRARIIAGIVAAVVIVGTFIIANGSSDSDKPAKTVTVTQTEATGGTTVETTTTTAAAVPTIVVNDAKPVGGVKELSFTNGDTIKFRVVSDTADEVHVHGYDLMKDVAPGQPVTFSFKADIEGRFEAELEDHKQQILDFKVNP
jgi:hypothetical protein